MQKRATFAAIAVPANAVAPVQLSSLTFTPTSTGTAIVRSRGFCTMTVVLNQLADVQIGAGASLAAIFPATPNFSDVTSITLPVGAPAGDYKIPFVSETSVAVTANVATTLVLGVRHSVASQSSATCIGSFQVDISATMP